MADQLAAGQAGIIPEVLGPRASFRHICIALVTLLETTLSKQGERTQRSGWLAAFTWTGLGLYSVFLECATNRDFISLSTQQPRNLTATAQWAHWLRPGRHICAGLAHSASTSNRGYGERIQVRLFNLTFTMWYVSVEGPRASVSLRHCVSGAVEFYHSVLSNMSTCQGRIPSLHTSELPSSRRRTWPR
jgi:hypothetical protein